MSFKKFLKNVSLPNAKMGTTRNSYSGTNMIYSKYKNYLPMVYQGPNNRMERYTIYDGMEQDPIISWSLDIIADSITQVDKKNPFQIEYDDNTELPDSQTLSIETALDEWVKTEDWKKRIFDTVRDVLKYGDVFFIRDPETLELQRVNTYDVLGVVVDELKNPTHYIIKNVDLNVPLKVATAAASDIETRNYLNTINTNFPNIINNSNAQQVNNPNDDQTTLPVKAEHVVHISLNVDDVLIYPFGVSTLENIYKAYIQKMLLQDCILLYRIKNATEKLVFSIPVGNVPRYKRRQFLEKCKNEMSQRRMPSKDTDGVFNTIDVAYNSISMNEDFWLPVDADGVQPKVEKLAGGQNLGEINDMVYWENLLIRGLKVPQSWVPYGPNDGQRTIPTNTSNTYVQEQRFYKYCQRLQNILIKVLDEEFKKYLAYKGIVEVDNDGFNLAFFDPTNITELTEEEIRANRLNTFLQAVGSPYISKQFALKFYLKLTEEEYNENQRLLIMENQERFKEKDVPLPTEDYNQTPGLRSVGIEDIPQDYLNDVGQDMGQDMGMGSFGGPMGDMSSAGGDMASGGMGADMGAGGMGSAAGGMGTADYGSAGL